ncbi:MAG TPA: TetR/AcrR family transcriptional regulator [Mycobacterium sp.]|nr:TetR/AcrR family transcriptional regulator [Mycobacterium sp.]
MSATASVDPRRQRHDDKRAWIVASAWELAQEQGLAGLSLRALAARVGLRQPSLYAYFGSKNDLYDAMFAHGNEQLLAWFDDLALPTDGAEALRAFSVKLMAFFTGNAMRYELMFERTLPGFEPSPASFALAQRFYDRMREEVLVPAGVRTSEQIDVYVALMAGIAAAQLANEPGGQRWTRHVDWVIDMFLREITRRRRPRGGR